MISIIYSSVPIFGVPILMLDIIIAMVVVMAFRPVWSYARSRFQDQELKSVLRVVEKRVACNNLLKQLANNGQHEQSQSLLLRMNSVGVSPNVVSYNLLMKAVLKAGARLPEAVEEILSKMQNEDIHPNAASYRHLMEAYCTACPAQCAKAKGVLTTMESAGIQLELIDFNTVMAAYSRCVDDTGIPAREKSDFEIMTQLLAEIDSRKIEPDSLTFAMLMESVPRTAAGAEMLESVVADMRRRGLSACLLTYQKLASAYVNSIPPRREDALHILSIAEGAGFTNTCLYNKVIKAFIYAEAKPDVIEGIIHKMKERGVRRSSITYTSLITAHANAPEVDPTKAEQVLEDMLADELPPTLITMTSMLKMYAQAQPPRVEKMLKLLQNMEDDGLEPNVISYNIVMALFATKPSQPERCEEILSRMMARGLSPNRLSYNTIGRAYLNSSPVLAEEAEGVLWRIKAAHEAKLCEQSIETDDNALGEMWDETTWTTAISAYARCQPPRPQDGMRLLHTMHKYGLKSDPLAFSGVIAAHMNMRPPQIKEAENVLKTMISLKIKPNAFSFMSIAMAYASTRPASLKDAQRVVYQMESHGYAPDLMLKRKIANETKYAKKEAEKRHHAY